MSLILFDVDGTLTPSGGMIHQEMVDCIKCLSEMENVTLGLVGGGSLTKIKWQMADAIKYFKYIFSECGAVVSIDNNVVCEKNMLDHCDRSILNEIVRRALLRISEMPIIFHGTQLDFRKGLVYISPPGIQATDYERNIFMKLDQELDLRKKLLAELKSLDINNSFEMSIGGAVGIAVHPVGWNKSQVIKYLIENGVSDKIYYLGDRTEPDGNDYPIYSHPMVNGISVTDYHDTIIKIKILFLKRCET